jgi:hypothetical protein
MLTKDELDQIRGVVHEEVTDAEKRLNGRMDKLDGRMEALELNVESFRAEQKAANTEIISTLHDIIETNAKETEKRFVRIEKHLDLPPVK